MKIKGRVRIRKNGLLIIEHENTIHNDLKEYLAECLADDGPGYVLSPGDLFTAQGQSFGGSEDGNHGILMITDAGVEKTLTTQEVFASVTGEKKWRGNYSASTSEVVDRFAIGHNFNSGTDPFFKAAYATFNPSNIQLFADDTLIVTWTIGITN